MTASDPSAPVTSGDSALVVSFEDFVTGRLALVTIRNQLEIQIASLRSQLAIAESQLRQTEDLLRRADQKMAVQFPEAVAFLEGTAERGRTH